MLQFCKILWMEIIFYLICYALLYLSLLLLIIIDYVLCNSILQRHNISIIFILFFICVFCSIHLICTLSFYFSLISFSHPIRHLEPRELLPRSRTATSLFLTGRDCELETPLPTIRRDATGDVLSWVSK